MKPLMINHSVKQVLVLSIISAILFYGYWVVGKDYHFIHFGMSAKYSSGKVFVGWLITTLMALVSITFLLKQDNLTINQSGFNKKQLLIAQAFFWLLFLIQRIYIYQFWEPLRIDGEQFQWPAIGRTLYDSGLANMLSYRSHNMWAGQYNSFYAYLIGFVDFIVTIDSWFSYRMLSVGIVGLTGSLLVIILNRVFGKTAVVFFMAATIFTGYMNFASFYMKHHVMILLFYALMMVAIFNYWKKLSLFSALLLSITCFLAFIAYIGCIYYLPIALFAILFGSISRYKKAAFGFLVATPTLALLFYLLAFPEKWPSGYFINKAIWHKEDPIFFLLDNGVAELKFLFIPGNLWGWLMQAAFILGLCYTFTSKQKEVWIWFVSLASGLSAMLLSSDREMGHNFIVMLPYMVMATIGASRTWDIHLSSKKAVKALMVAVVVFGFISELYLFALSNRWMGYQVFDMASPLDTRVWFFDDARKLTPYKDSTILIDASLINKTLEPLGRLDIALNTPPIANYSKTFSELSVFKDAIFLSEVKEVPKLCEGVLLTDRTIEQTQSLLGKQASITLLEKYRPANPRYDYNQYQPDVFHYLYRVENKKYCM